VSEPAFGTDSAGGAPPGDGRDGAGASGEEVPRGIAAAVVDVSERVTLLVREEVELAKAEVAEKATKLARGAVVGVAAGVFILTALFFFLIGCAWLLYFYLPGSTFAYFWGFFAMALILLLLGLLAGMTAARAVRRGSPPTPEMAIEEARLIRETVSSTAPDARETSAGPSVAETTPPASPSDAEPPSAPYGAAAPHAPEQDA
jgi:Putative Actinobacterial Holin-X, holin superfamily III